MHTIDVAGIPVTALDYDAFLALLTDRVSRPGSDHHISLNAAKWVAARSDPVLRSALRQATSIGADGVSVLWAARRAGTPLPGRVPGFELATALVARAATAGWRVALLGGTPDVSADAAVLLRRQGVDIVWAADGYFAADRAADRAAAISATRPDLLLVAMGSPRAERWVARHQPAASLTLGVGGTLDVWTGRAQRAPAVTQRWGLEWAWRFATAPRLRFRRAVVGSAAFISQITAGRRVDLSR